MELCFTFLLSSVKQHTSLCNVLKISGYNLFLVQRSITLGKVVPCAKCSPGSCSFVCCLIFLSLEDMESWKQYQHDAIAYTLIYLGSEEHRGWTTYLTLCSELYTVPVAVTPFLFCSTLIGTDLSFPFQDCDIQHFKTCFCPFQSGFCCEILV